jgi:hypothetical protein
MGLLVLLGFFMARKGWLSSDTLSDLTRILIDVVIPCTFILAMARSFTFEFFRQGFVPALVAAGWIVASWGLGALWFRLFPGDSVNRDRSVTAMMMISNSIYLPLPVILAVVPEPMHDTATMYISIVALPSILIMWTAGVALLSGSAGPSPGERLKMVFNAPILSVVAGILLTLIPGVREAALSEPGSFFPAKMLFSGMGYLSRILSPLAMLILGGLIASGAGNRRVPLKYVVPLIGVRLLLIPAVVYGLIRSGLLELPSLASTALILVAAAPPATNHALIARRYHGEWALVSALQLITHVVALATLPLWLSVGLGL